MYKIYVVMNVEVRSRDMKTAIFYSCQLLHYVLHGSSTILSTSKEFSHSSHSLM